MKKENLKLDDLTEDDFFNEEYINSNEKVSEIEDNRRCGYRNCECDISHMRKNSKYCCREHKNYENMYIRREIKRVEKKREYIKNMIDQIKNNDQSILDLYKNIYK